MACPNTHTQLGFQRCPVHASTSTSGKGRSGLGDPGNQRARSDRNQHQPRACSPGHTHVRHPPGPRSRNRAHTTNTRRDCGSSRSLTILETALGNPLNLLESAGQTAHFRFRGRDTPPHHPPEVRPSGQEGKRAWEEQGVALGRGSHACYPRGARAKGAARVCAGPGLA